jgi:hypothetical protein
MARGGSLAQASGNNGGILGSGIFGMVGSVVQCKADDNSWYCSLSKLVSGLMMLFILFFIIYIVINVLWNSSYYYKQFFGKSGKR